MVLTSEVEFEFLLLNVDFSVEEFYNYEDNTVKSRIIINDPNNIIAYQTWTSSSNHINGQDRMVIPLNGYNFVKTTEIYNANVNEFIKYKPTCVLRVGEEKYFFTVEEISHSGSPLQQDESNNFKDSISNSNNISLVCSNNFTDLNENRNGKRMKKVPEGQHNGKFNFSPLKFKHIDHNDTLKSFLEENGIKYFNHDAKGNKKYGFGNIDDILYHTISTSGVGNEKAKDFNFILEDKCDITLKNEKTTVITITNPKMITYYEDWNEDSGLNNNHAKRDYNKITASQLIQHVDRFNNNTRFNHTHSTSLHKFKPTVYIEINTDQGVMPFISIIKNMKINHNSVDSTSLALLQETDTILTIELENSRMIDPSGNILSNPTAMSNKNIYMNIDSASAGIEMNNTLSTCYTVGINTIIDGTLNGYLDPNAIFGFEGLTELIDEGYYNFITRDSENLGNNSKKLTILPKKVKPVNKEEPVKKVNQVKKLEPVKEKKFTSLEKMLIDETIDIFSERKSNVVSEIPENVVFKDDPVDPEPEVTTQEEPESASAVQEITRSPTVLNLKVRVENDLFVIDDMVTPNLRFSTQCKYVFDQSDVSNQGKRITFGIENGKNDLLYDGIINSRAEPGTENSKVTFFVNENINISDLFYYIKGKPDSGNVITVIQQFTIRNAPISQMLWVALVGLFKIYNLNQNRIETLLYNVNHSPIINQSKSIKQLSKDTLEEEVRMGNLDAYGLSRLETMDVYGVDIKIKNVNPASLPLLPEDSTYLQIKGRNYIVGTKSYLKTEDGDFLSVQQIVNNFDQVINTIYISPITKQPLEISKKHFDVISSKLDECKPPNFCYVKVSPRLVEQPQLSFIKEIYLWNSIPISKGNAVKDYDGMITLANNKTYNSDFFIDMASIINGEGVKKIGSLSSQELNRLNYEITNNNLNVDPIIQPNYSYYDIVYNDGYHYPVNSEMIIPIELLTDIQIDYLKMTTNGGTNIHSVLINSPEDYNLYFTFPEKHDDLFYSDSIKEEFRVLTVLNKETDSYISKFLVEEDEDESYVSDKEELMQGLEATNEFLVEATNEFLDEEMENFLQTQLSDISQPTQDSTSGPSESEKLSTPQKEYLQTFGIGFLKNTYIGKESLYTKLGTLLSKKSAGVEVLEKIISAIGATSSTVISENISIKKGKGGIINVKNKDPDPVYATGALPGTETSTYDRLMPGFSEGNYDSPTTEQYEAIKNAQMVGNGARSWNGLCPKAPRPVLSARPGPGRPKKNGLTPLTQNLAVRLKPADGIAGLFAGCDSDGDDADDFVDMERLAEQMGAQLHEAVSNPIGQDGRPVRVAPTVAPTVEDEYIDVVPVQDGPELPPRVPPRTYVSRAPAVNRNLKPPASTKPEIQLPRLICEPTHQSIADVVAQRPAVVNPNEPITASLEDVLGKGNKGLISSNNILNIKFKESCEQDGITFEAQNILETSEQIEAFLKQSADIEGGIDYYGRDAAIVAEQMVLEQHFNKNIDINGNVDFSNLDTLTIDLGIEEFVGKGVLSSKGISVLRDGFTSVLSNMDLGTSIEEARTNLSQSLVEYANSNTDFNSVINGLQSRNPTLTIERMVDTIMVTSIVKTSIRDFTVSLDNMSKLFSIPQEGDLKQVLQDRFGSDFNNVYDQLMADPPGGYGMNENEAFSTIVDSLSDAIIETQNSLIRDKISLKDGVDLKQLSYEAYDEIFKTSLKSSLELRLPQEVSPGLKTGVLNNFQSGAISSLKKLNFLSDATNNIDSVVNDINRKLSEVKQTVQSEASSELGSLMAEALMNKGSSYVDQMKSYGLTPEEAYNKLVSDMAKSSERALQETMKAINEGSIRDYSPSSIQSQIDSNFRTSLEETLKGSLNAQLESYTQDAVKQEELEEAQQRNSDIAENTTMEFFP